MAGSTRTREARRADSVNFSREPSLLEQIVIAAVSAKRPSTTRRYPKGNASRYFIHRARDK